MRIRPLFACLAAFGLALACSPTAPTTPTSKGSTKPKASATAKASSSPGVTVKGGEGVGGQVRAPRDTKAGSYGLLLRTDLPVANAPIALVSLDTAAKVTPQGKANAQGNYEVRGLAVAELVRVRASVKLADGTAVSLETLAKAGQSLAADLDVGSTLVAVTLVAHAKGGTIDYSAIEYAKAVAAVQSELEGKELPDLTSNAALIARAEALARTIKDVNAVLGGPMGTSPPASPDKPATPDKSVTPAASPDKSATPDQAATADAAASDKPAT